MWTEPDLFNINEFYYNLIDTSRTGIIAIDKQETIVIFNRIAEDMMGIGANEVLWHPFSVLLGMTGHTDSLLLSTLRNGSAYELIEATINSVTGPINVLAYTDLIKDQDETVIGAYLGLRDITPQKQLEEQVFKNEKFSAFGELAAGIAHEIRNPLTSIMGFLQLFDANLDSADPNKVILDIILKEIERANNTIKKFLLLTKPVIPILKEINIIELLYEVAALIKEDALAHKVEVIIKKEDAMPVILIDPEQIKQVLLNIVNNAILAMPEGGSLTLETFYEAENRKVHILVTDTGIGMDTADLEKIFDPFYTTRAEGAGLGLTVSFKIIQNHSGKIEVESVLGKGSTFRVILPVLGI